VERSSDPLVGKTISKYTILSILGGGGMGTVYLARQSPVNREVAVKVINVDLKTSEQFIKRFDREARSIAALEHPHIIPVIDYGTEGDLTYMVMALKKGGNLGDLIKKEKLSLQEIYRLVSQIGLALDYAHQKGIIHRDLKPANILLDEERNTFLTDFGIAKKLGETKLTAQGMVVGSPIYMAPEAWRGEDAGSETDIYSLGIILFEMLTGQPPYVDKVPARLMLKHISDPIPSLTAYRNDLNPEVDQVVQQALSKERYQRYSTGAQLTAALRNAFSRSAAAAAPSQPKRNAMSEDTAILPSSSNIKRPATPPPVSHPAPSVPSPHQVDPQATSPVPSLMGPPANRPKTGPLGQPGDQMASASRAGQPPQAYPQPQPYRPPTPQPSYPPPQVHTPTPVPAQPTGVLNNRVMLMLMGAVIILLLVVIVVLLITKGGG